MMTHSKHETLPVNTHLLQRWQACSVDRVNTLAALLVTLLLLVNLLPCGVLRAQAAWADEDTTSAEGTESAEGTNSASDAPKTAYQLERDIEKAQTSYLEAREAADEAASKVTEHERKIRDIENNLLPNQQKRTSEAARELYKLQQGSVSLVDVLLNAGSLREFITHFEYIAHITGKHYDELQRLTALKEELENSHAELRAIQDEADAKAADAAAALDAAKDAQAEAQRRVEEDALLQAQIAANAASLAESPRQNDSGSLKDFAASDETSGNSPGSTNSGSGNSSSSEQNSSGADGGSGSENPGGSDSGSGSSSSADSGTVQPPPAENDSLAGWTARIDAYLAGSPLAGQGATFASAALANGIDPRFSPAIACLESGKGRFCFLPYNAWGWGSVSWGSWEEAINAHVRGLASIYGFAPTIEGAKMYCPPNWEHWYNTVCSQMALI